jgi:hypothetical protein
MSSSWVTATKDWRVKCVAVIWTRVAYMQPAAHTATSGSLTVSAGALEVKLVGHISRLRIAHLWLFISRVDLYVQTKTMNYDETRYSILLELRSESQSDRFDRLELTVHGSLAILYARDPGKGQWLSCKGGRVLSKCKWAFFHGRARTQTAIVANIRRTSSPVYTRWVEFLINVMDTITMCRP